MTKCQAKEEKSGANLLILLCWLVYTISYLGKVNYSANITQVIDYYHITKSQAGMVPTFFFFAYGIGQVVNGSLCKKYNKKWIVFTSLILSSVINLLVAVIRNADVIKWLWMLNGFSLSILWPTLVQLLSENVPQKDLGRSSVVMGTTVAAGTLAIYGLSSIYAIFDKFKLAFYTATFAGIIVSIVWILFFKRAVSMAKDQMAKENYVKVDKEVVQQKTLQSEKERKLFGVSISILCFFAIGVNLIKDGLTTWVPSILKEEYSMTDSLSILLTLFLPILAIFGNAIALKIHKKIPDYITHCFVIFATMSGFIGLIIGSLSLGQVLTMLIGLVVVNFLASSLNSLITSIFPMFMRGKVNSGLCAGVLNGFCYLGSTVSSYGLGFMADHYGWKSVFWCLMVFCALVAVVWGGYIAFKHSLKLNKGSER